MLMNPKADIPRKSAGRRSAASPGASTLEKQHSLRDMIARRQSAGALLESYMGEVPPDEAMPARVQMEPGFILHTWEWSESSQLLDVLSMNYGRVFLVAKGAKRPSSQMRGLLSAFCPLLFDWSGRKEAKTLQRVHWLGTLVPMSGEALMSGFYINELVMKLCAREERHPGLFRAYLEVLDVLALGQRESTAPALRSFEKLILTLAGWAPATDGYPAGELYCVREGVICATARSAGVPLYERSAVSALLEDRFTERASQRAVRDILRDLIHYHLGTRELNTRRILNELNALKRESEVVA